MAEPEIFDITRPLTARTPVWPGDPGPRIEVVSSLSAGDPVNMAALHIGVHSGTHADAPYHVSADGARIGSVPLEAFIGPALVVDATGREWIDSELVEPVLASRDFVPRLLFRTGAWSASRGFPTRFAGVHAGAAARISAAGVRLVGTDAPSVDPFDSQDLPAHRAFAEAGIVNLENLDLDGIHPGAYELIALPLRLPDADGSPVRAVLRRR